MTSPHLHICGSGAVSLAVRDTTTVALPALVMGRVGLIGNALTAIGHNRSMDVRVRGWLAVGPRYRVNACSTLAR